MCPRYGKLAALFLNERTDDALINPLDLVTIEKEQQQDKALLLKLKAGTPNLQLKTFCGGVQVICQGNLIYIPKTLQESVSEWYHIILCHSGTSRTKEIIRHHLTWPGLRNHVLACVQTCDVCQHTKRKNVITDTYQRRPRKRNRGKIGRAHV